MVLKVLYGTLGKQAMQTNYTLLRPLGYTSEVEKAHHSIPNVSPTRTLGTASGSAALNLLRPFYPYPSSAFL